MDSWPGAGGLAGGLAWRARRALVDGGEAGLGWWAVGAGLGPGLEGIFIIFEILTFFNDFLKYLKGWRAGLVGGAVAWAGGLARGAGLVAWGWGVGLVRILRIFQNFNLF